VSADGDAAVGGVGAGGPGPRAAGAGYRWRGWRLWLVSLVVPVVFLAVGLHTRNDFGETWDEQFDQDIGRFYLNDWAKTGIEGLRSRFIPLQRNYGPFFDVVVVAAHQLLHQRLGIVSDVAGYHMPVLFVSALGLWLVFWFGYRLWGLMEGVVAAATLAVMPQFIAHSQNNLKDMPLAVFFSLALFVLVEAVRQGSLRLFAVAGVVAGLTYGIKLNALFLAPIVILWQLPEIRFDLRRWGRLAAGLVVTGIVGFLTVLLVWPYYRHAPWDRVIETLKTFSSHEYNEYVFYLGHHFRAHDVPWHFPFVMLGVNTPLVVVVLLTVSLFFLASAWVRRSDDRSPLTLLWVWLLLPPVVQAASGTAMLDGVRHYLLVLPAMALLAAGAAAWSVRLLARWGRGAQGALAALLTVALGLALRTDIRLHPYEGVFFNSLTGGTAGAAKRFELDYWGVSLKAAAAWLDANAPTGSRVWLTIPGQHFFRLDPNRFRFVNGLSGRPNYKVSLIRGLLKTFDTEEDYLRPKRKPVFEVKVDGAALLKIFEYDEFRDLPDGAVLKAAPDAIAQTEPGLLGLEYENGRFEGKGTGPTVWRSLEFDCQHNPYADREVSVRMAGLLHIPEPGSYTFEVDSDDDAALFLNGRAVLTNASMDTTRRTLRLDAGAYRIRLDYRNLVGPACLRVSWGRTGQGPLVLLGVPYVSHNVP
jgi:hypothetical protein